MRKRKVLRKVLWKALLFDLDGTISETDSLHFPAWAAMLAPHGHDVDWDFYERNISGRLNPDIAADFMPNLSVEEREKIVEDKEVDFRSRVHTLETMPGLREIVARGREAEMSIALVTNAPRPNALAVMAALGLENDFDHIILADDAGAGKPDPAPYLMALDILDLPPTEAIAFEDSTSGVKSATAAGIPTVGIASTHAPETLENAGSIAVFRDFTDPGLASTVFG